MSGIKRRHFFFNLGGIVAPILVALAAFPVIARYAGAERLGFMSLAWTVVGYLGLLDMGLSRVVVRRVAQARDAQSIAIERKLVATITLRLFLISLPVAAMLALLVPIDLLLGNNTDLNLRAEAQVAWWIICGTLPVAVLTAVLAGVLDGRQWFGLANVFRVVFGTWSFIAPMVVVVFLEPTLPAMIATVAVGRFLAVVAHGIAAHRALPAIAHDQESALRVPALTPVLIEGGWLTITNIVGPVMTRLDRFIVSSVVSLAAAAYYSVPQELALRMLLMPMVAASTLFPTFARAHADEDEERQRHVAGRGLMAILTLSLPMALALALLSPPVLNVWMSAEFAARSAVPAAILAIGMYAMSVGQVPYLAIQATGRADLTAKLHLAELPIFIIALVWLTRAFGIEGAAIAWSARGLIDCIALMLAAHRLGISGADRSGTHRFVAGGALIIAAAITATWMHGVAYWTMAAVLLAVGAVMCARWARELLRR